MGLGGELGEVRCIYLGYIGIMEKKMETIGIIGIIQRLYRVM